MCVYTTLCVWVTQVRYLVLDEADKLLALGFLEQVDALLAAAAHPSITRALFSATLPEKVRGLPCCTGHTLTLCFPPFHSFPGCIPHVLGVVGI